MPNGESLADQYADDAALSTRGSFNERFSTLDRHPHRWVFERADLPPGATVVEVGCGNGSLWVENAERLPPGLDALLTDVSPGMVRAARDRLRTERRTAGVDEGESIDVESIDGESVEEESVDGEPTDWASAAAEFAAVESVASESAGDGRQVRYTVADAGAIPVRDDAADVAFANQMLYHVPDLDATLREVRRVLRDDGVLYATTRTRRSKRRLFEIADEVLAGDVRPPNANSTFAVENGAGALDGVFGDVRLHTLDSSALVDDPDALVSYLASMREFAGVPDFGPDAAERLRERFAAETADGPLVLQGLFGLFEVRP